MHGATSINKLNNDNRRKVENAFEVNENREKLSEWSIRENISDTAIRVQAEVIQKTAPKSSQLIRQSLNIVPQEAAHARRRTSI